MYRKFKADHIFTGFQILPGDFVLITDTEGIVIDIVNVADAGDDVKLLKGLLTPGFVNAHCHIELSHLKGVIPCSTGLVRFVQQVMNSRVSSDETKLIAMQAAELEMLENGIVAVGDICNTADSIPLKQHTKLLWHNFIEVSGFTDAGAGNRLAEIKKVQADFKAYNKCDASLSPHAPYSVSKTLFEKLDIETGDQVISIHNQECSAENDLFQNKTGDFLNLYNNVKIDISSFQPTGKTSLQSWLPYFKNKQSIISVHNTFTTLADINFCNQQVKADDTGAVGLNDHLFFCLCVNANNYIEQKLPPIDLLRKNGYPIVIGTDSYASNWQLNILDEIKTIQRETNFTIPLTEILQWATINGAFALRMDNLLGSFEKNKKPGVVIIEGLDHLNTTPKSSAHRIL